MVWILPVAFLGVAFLYAMAGFGGGSSYLALLAVFGLPVAAIPVLALTCNLIVSSQGSFQLARSGHLSTRLMVPLFAGSIPAAFLGGAWHMSEETYLFVLAVVLTLSGLALLLPPSSEKHRTAPAPALAVIGGILGGLAGISGIGGGIFLAPVLHLLRLESSKAIAGCAALFIAVNSAAGLAGQLTKGLGRLESIPLALYLACPLAVLCGGILGTRVLTHRLSPLHVRRVTGTVVLIAAFRLWIKLLFGL